MSTIKTVQPFCLTILSFFFCCFCSVNAQQKGYNPSIQSLMVEPTIPSEIKVGYYDDKGTEDPNDDTCRFKADGFLSDCDQEETIDFDLYLANIVASEMAAAWGWGRSRLYFDSPLLSSGNKSGMNALKAQAIAARSFAINYMVNSAANNIFNQDGIIGNTPRRNTRLRPWIDCCQAHQAH